MSQDISTKEIYKCEECREKDNKIAELEAELKAWEELRQKQEVSVGEIVDKYYSKGIEILKKEIISNGMD